jgi:Na+-driven multidrug efflux pump
MSSSASFRNVVVWLAFLMVSSSLIMTPHPHQVLGFHMPRHPIRLRQKRLLRLEQQPTMNWPPLSLLLSLSLSSTSLTSRSQQQRIPSFMRLAMTKQNDENGDEQPEKNFFPLSSQSTNNNNNNNETTSLSSSSFAFNKNDNQIDNNKENNNKNIADEDDSNNNNNDIKSASSKRQMLGFAIPALGIYLSNPLLSNIDNAFVGHMVGTKGLAALSPATICTDQMLYLFSFLARATTGLVSRAYGGRVPSDDQEPQQLHQGKTNDAQRRAQEAGSPPLTAALVCGVGLSILYAFATPWFLSLLNVDPSLRPSAASYIYWRGSIAWAALSQSVALSIMMATRDAMTPLKIIGLSALVNVIGDYLLCVWPLQWGCGGAAAATAVATLVSSGCMIQALKAKNLLPPIRIPTKQQLWELMEFTGPLMAITVTRLIGFVSMQRAAMRMGVQTTAAYQLSINLVVFFLLFGEPLSQLSQTKLPALIDDAAARPNKTTKSTSKSNKGTAVINGSSTGMDDTDDNDRSSSDTTTLLVRETFKSVLALGAWTALGIGSIAGLLLRFGSGLFSTDIAVQELAQAASPAVFINVVIAIFAGTCCAVPSRVVADSPF